MPSENAGARPVLVVGGAGKTGRRVAERLQARGVPRRIASRSTPIPFDWDDEATWRAAVEGAGALYVAYQPDLAVPGAAEKVRRLAEMAAGAGAWRLVLLSGRGEQGAERAEQAVRSSGVEWTILRCSWFNQNFSEGYLLGPVLAGEVALPVGDVGEPFVDVDDIADVAVEALTEDGHAGRLHELTGPRLLSFSEAVQEISLAAGRPVRFVQVTLEEYTSALRGAGVPEEVVAFLAYLFRRGAGRAQRQRGGRCAGGPGQGASRLPRLRPRGGRVGSLGCGGPGRSGPLRRPAMVVVAAVVAGVALVLNGGIGGLFYAYSISVVPALDAIEADKAVRAMQSVNRRILNPAFFATFLGAPVASAATGGVLLALGQPVAGALISWPPWCTCWACSCRPGW